MAGKASRSAARVRKIAAVMKNVHFERLVAKAFKVQEKRTRSLREAIRDSERLNEEDYSVRINARD